jgi:hypothetical protein
MLFPPAASGQSATEYMHQPALQPGSKPPKEASKRPQEAPKPKPDEELKQEAAKLSRYAQQKVRDFAQYSEGQLQKLSEPPAKGWLVLAVGMLVALTALLWGWTLIQALLIPFAPVWGLATGGVMGFCIVQAFYTARPVWFRLMLVAVGVTLGVGLYLFAALKAKPVAAFLVIMSPFLIIATFLFDYNTVVGIAVFCAGFLAGFAAMLEVRPLAIICTSAFGATCTLGCWGVLSYLIGPKLVFIKSSFVWLTDNPLMLLLAWAVVTFIGVNFQFTTGPRGTLEG